MQFLNNLISKIGVFVFFIILEIAALFLTVIRSDFHKNAIGHETMAVKGYLTDKYNSITHFFDLPNENQNLAIENAKLKEKLAILLHQKNAENISVNDLKIDSTLRKTYSFTQAKIVDYSLDKKDNYFILNKGRKDGIKEDMGVLTPNGIVGAVLGVGDHYASVLSVMHSKSKVKAKIKGQSRFGIIIWDGQEFNELSLTEIPKYLNVKVGDTVVTAGASAAYPEGALIGRIKTLTPNNNTGDFDIKVEMFDNLSKVRNVYVVNNLDIQDIQKAKEKEDVISE